MAAGREPRGRRRRRLSSEERDLWSRIAGTAKPLHPDRAERRAAPPMPDALSEPARRDEPVLPAVAEAETRDAALSRATRSLRPGGPDSGGPLVTWSPPVDDRPGPVGRRTPGLDGGTARRLGRGRLEPEARLDLHGMTADRAHGALAGFIASASARGLRCVLIVTGMGRGEGGRGDGVLRRQTPRWLGVAPLAGMVVGVFEAHPRHGGAGALYVYLKKRR